MIVVEVVYSQLSASNNYYGTITFSSTGAFSTEAAVEDAPNRKSDGYKEGTGSIGGWEQTEMRAYLKDTIKPLIPETVRAAIKEVSKAHPAYNTAGSQFTQTTADDVWLPSYNEMFSSSRPYKALFPDNASRVKYKVGATSASWWWLRSADSSSNFYCVSSGGYVNYYGAYSSYGVALGFCT